MKFSPCLLGFGLLGASLYSTLAKESPMLFRSLEDSLDERQRLVYQIIKMDRMRLYLTGLALGTVLALAVLYYQAASDMLSNICLFVTISWGFTLFYYLLMPKNDYMVKHLQNGEQVDKWLAVYRDMQFRYTAGFLLGIAAYALLCYGAVMC